MELEFIADMADKNPELFIYLDDEGLRSLLRAVEAARTTGHEHLMSEAWGGKDLTISEGSSHSFNKVTVTFVIGDQ